MKKLFMMLICFVVAMESVSSQSWSLEAKKKAINAVRCKLKAPSTFILTDEYGHKIPVEKVYAEYLKGYTEYDSIRNSHWEDIVDSIEYIFCSDCEKILDSVTYYTKKEHFDSITYYKRIYRPCYKVSFYYEAQNSLGGMVQDFAVVYMEKNDCVFRYRDYNDRNYEYVELSTMPPYTKAEEIKQPKCIKIAYQQLDRVKKFPYLDHTFTCKGSFQKAKNIDWTAVHNSEHVKGINAPFYHCERTYYYNVDITEVPFSTYGTNICPLCKDEFHTLGEKYYKKLVKKRYLKYISSKEYRDKEAEKERVKKMEKKEKRNRIKADRNYKKEKLKDYLYF